MAIRANDSIQGVDIADKQYKIRLFADDFLLHITNPLMVLFKGTRTFWYPEQFQN